MNRSDTSQLEKRSARQKARAVHVPVMVHEVLQFLALRPGAVVLDCCVGTGGHAAFFLKEIGPSGKLIGFDVDPAMIELARANLQSFVESGVAELVHDSYVNAAAHARHGADAVFLDLGQSSVQLDQANRGFSFLKDGPLDMRFDQTSSTPTAADVVNSLSEEELADLIRNYGEERFSRRIAKAICAARQRKRIETTRELAEIVQRAVPGRRRRIHKATRTFQALRIYLSGELENVRVFVQGVPDLLKPRGRFVALSYHSLEDRIVKQCLREHEKNGLLKRLNRKVIRPTENEITSNPRARSAKLRAAQRV